MNTPHLVQGVNTPHLVGVVSEKHPPLLEKHPPLYAENTHHLVGGHQAVHQASITIPLVLARPHRCAARAAELPTSSHAETGQ
jgi:hypothetical protein